MRLAVIDTETTGTDPRRHHLWEVGLILREAGQPAAEYAWQVHPDLATADPAALRVGGYRDRCRVAAAAPGTVATLTAPAGTPEITTAPGLAALLARLLDGAVLAGVNVAFDRDFAAAFLAAHGEILTADYHLIEVCSLAAGWLACAGRPPSAPWRSDDLARALGIDPASYDRHSALADARYAGAIYDAATAAGAA
jgi:DNA polymerase III epsilon subunit-like protein